MVNNSFIIYPFSIIFDVLGFEFSDLSFFLDWKHLLNSFDIVYDYKEIPLKFHTSFITCKR